MAVLIENIHVDGVPALEVSQVGAAPHLPVVILVHGWTGHKEDMLFLAYFLTVNGFFTVSIDAVGHGERAREEDWTFEALLNLIQQTGEDVNRVIAHYEGDPRVDVQRVGLSGISMGGVITYEYLTREDKRIRAAVPMIGTPDFTSLVSGSNAEDIIKMLGLDPNNMMNVTALEAVKSIQPMQKMERMVTVPLLMLNGMDDPLIQLEGVRNFYRQIKPLYAQPEDVQFIEYPGVGHYTPYPMQLEALHWFQRYL
jgi:alpha-beta hydrolase superfamily lysophospholipase